MELDPMSDQCARCPQRHDNWPGPAGTKLCRECWGKDCDREFWRAIEGNNRAARRFLLAELLILAVVLFGMYLALRYIPSGHGT